MTEPWLSLKYPKRFASARPRSFAPEVLLKRRKGFTRWAEALADAHRVYHLLHGWHDSKISHTLISVSDHFFHRANPRSCSASLRRASVCSPTHRPCTARNCRLLFFFFYFIAPFSKIKKYFCLVSCRKVTQRYNKKSGFFGAAPSVRDGSRSSAVNRAERSLGKGSHC